MGMTHGICPVCFPGYTHGDEPPGVSLPSSNPQTDERQNFTVADVPSLRTFNSGYEVGD